MKIFFALALVTCSVVLGVDGECDFGKLDPKFKGDSNDSWDKQFMVACPCTKLNTTGCASLRSCQSNIKDKELCRADKQLIAEDSTTWNVNNCPRGYDIFKCIQKATKNVAIPKPGTACKSKITFPVKALKGVKGYPWMMEVFGIPIIATSKFKKSGKLNHVASIMAELLDQDSDGCVDDPNVLRNILIKSVPDGSKSKIKALPAMVLPNKSVTKAASNAMKEKGFVYAQDLFFGEVIPKCSGLNFTKTCSDSSIEEQFHFITSYGHSRAYSQIFATNWLETSNLTKAMDIARGKRMKETPKKLSGYPKTAWSRYTDTTCGYGCQSMEYLWWGYCSYSGICAGRSGAKGFESEFKLLKKTQLAKTDKRLYQLFDASAKKTTAYRLPTKPVDGTYTGCKKCLRKGGKSHGGK